jgi:hypothetical protein
MHAQQQQQFIRGELCYPVRAGVAAIVVVRQSSRDLTINFCCVFIQRASASQHGSITSHNASDENRPLQAEQEQDAHETSAAHSRSSTFHRNPQSPYATADAFPYDGSSSRQSHATSVGHQSFEASVCRSKTDASHIASVHSSLHYQRQFHEPTEWSYLDEADHSQSVASATMDTMSSPLFPLANADVDVMSRTLLADEGPPHSSLDSTENLNTSSCLNPMPPSPQRYVRSFQHYDDFMCSPDPANYAVSNQELLADDIAEDSPSPPSLPHRQRAAALGPPRGHAVSAKSRFFDPRPQSTIGPAKTIRPSLHQVHATQTGGVRRFQMQRPQPQPPPRVCITQRHRPSSSSSGPGGTKRMRSIGTETKNRSILDFMPRR